MSDQAGLNTEFYTNSIMLGGGESLDVVLDASDASCGSVIRYSIERTGSNIPREELLSSILEI